MKNNEMIFNKLMFSEFRVVPMTGLFKYKRVSNKRLTEALTINEELKNLGYTLNPEGIRQLTNAEDRAVLLTDIRRYVGEVKAAPMYPNFPTQVMNMDEATFRLHQMIHYFSTYGIEWLTGEEVDKGWMPNVESVEKIKDDETLLSASVIHLIEDIDKYRYAYHKILNKAERMTDKEMQMIKSSLGHLVLTGELYTILNDVNVKFKQNLLNIFYTIFNDSTITSDDKLHALHNLCQHTGDVWKCIDYVLTKEKFHLRTSQKRLLTKLLDSYPSGDFSTNLILSNKKAERVMLMLKYIDYITYTRNAENKASVSALRNGDLKSWESTAKRLISAKDSKALEFISGHPGQMLRMLTLLLRNGFKSSDIFSALESKADQLSTQTLVRLLSFFKELSIKEDFKETESVEIYDICKELLNTKLSLIATPLLNKKVFLQFPGYDLSMSTLETNDKSDEGGYIRSGIAYKIPDEIKRLRFFIYWNDKDRVDVDLHAFANISKDRLKRDRWGANIVHVGWNGDFNNTGIVYSGDITHSDAAEYIDIDIENTIASDVRFEINIYDGASSFKNIDECYTGMMAVNSLNENVKLYNPKNCFFNHYLTSNLKIMQYGLLDVKNRVLRFIGKSTDEQSMMYNISWGSVTGYTINDYVYALLLAQHSTIVDKRDDADVVLIMDKPMTDNEISLIDNNFFM